MAAAADAAGIPFSLSEIPLEKTEYEDIIGSEFSKDAEAIDKLDYTIAAACGVISAALDIFWLDKLNIADAAVFGSEQIGKFVIKAAKLVGYHGNDINDAVSKIVSITNPKARHMSGDFEDFASQPSAAGLCFSILTQFTGKVYGTDADGRFTFRDIPDRNILGTGNPSKILNGVLIWALASGSVMSAVPEGVRAKGIPEAVSSLLNDISRSPLFQMKANKAKSGEVARMEDIYALASDILGDRFDLQAELGGQYDIMKFSLSILVNECLVRGFYMLRRLLMEIKNKNIRSRSDLSKLESANFLPFNSRVITRMLTVSSGTFVAVTTAKAAVVAARSSAGGWKGSVIDFVAHINYGGLVSFVFACKADGEYVISDAKQAYAEMLAWKRLLKQEEQEMFRSFGRMRLGNELTRLLDSLKRQKLLYDIRAAKGMKELEKKQAWLFAWEDDIARSRQTDEENYFIDDEDSIYDVINEKIDASLEAENSDFLWLYIMAVELKLFAPYQGLEYAEKSGGLLLKNDYETEIFCTRQTVITASELDEIIHLTEEYVGVLSSSEGQKNAGIAAAAILTGGASLIPMAIAKGRGKDVDEAARKAVASVNTNVLRSTGQIAGMFGSPGSAIYSGGLSVPYECARILAICEYVLKGKNNDIAAVENINRYFYEQIVSIEGKIFSINEDGSKKSEAKRRIQRLEANWKYFSKCRDILTEMCENW